MPAPHPAPADPPPSELFEPLDPTQPYLDHHRAGGLPLFGTAMGIATMSRAVRGMRADAAAIEAVGVHDPYILHGDPPHGVITRIDPAAHDGAMLRARLIRADPRLAPMVLFDAVFRFGAIAALAPAMPACAEGGVTTAEVYRVFFPGPAFQVIAAARLHGATLVSRLTAGPVLIPWQARLIEFAMQSAGLLELATSGRRMIPHRLGRIAPVAPVINAPAAPHAIHAVARHAADGPGIDIAVSDAAGQPIMVVQGYETVELPFPADPATAAWMSSRLRETAG